jgi:hypothetical protein
VHCDKPVYTILKEAEEMLEKAEARERLLLNSNHALKTSLDQHREHSAMLRQAKVQLIGKHKAQLDLTRLLSRALANRDHVIVDLQAPHVDPRTHNQAVAMRHLEDRVRKLEIIHER